MDKKGQSEATVTCNLVEYTLRVDLERNPNFISALLDQCIEHLGPGHLVRDGEKLVWLRTK